MINKAISDTNEKKDFYWTKLETGSSSMKNIQNRKEINKVSVNAITFDSYFWKKKIAIDFIKCDVEGSELFVFQGATSYLKNYKPVKDYIKEIKTACLWKKKSSTFSPDFCAINLNDDPWIVQPTEHYEELSINDLNLRRKKG